MATFRLRTAILQYEVNFNWALVALLSGKVCCDWWKLIGEEGVSSRSDFPLWYLIVEFLDRAHLHLRNLNKTQRVLYWGLQSNFWKLKKEVIYTFFITVRPCVSFEFMESVTFSWGIFLGRFSVVTTIKTASKYKPLLLQCTGGSSAFTRGVGTGTFQWEWNFTDAKPVSWKTFFHVFFWKGSLHDIQCRINYQQCAF